MADMEEIDYLFCMKLANLFKQNYPSVEHDDIESDALLAWLEIKAKHPEFHFGLYKTAINRRIIDGIRQRHKTRYKHPQINSLDYELYIADSNDLAPKWMADPSDDYKYVDDADWLLRARAALENRRRYYTLLTSPKGTIELALEWSVSKSYIHQMRYRLIMYLMQAGLLPVMKTRSRAINHYISLNWRAMRDFFSDD